MWHPQFSWDSNVDGSDMRNPYHSVYGCTQLYSPYGYDHTNHSLHNISPFPTLSTTSSYQYGLVRRARVSYFIRSFFHYPCFIVKILEDIGLPWLQIKSGFQISHHCGLAVSTMIYKTLPWNIFEHLKNFFSWAYLKPFRYWWRVYSTVYNDMLVAKGLRFINSHNWPQVALLKLEICVLKTQLS